MKELKFGEIGIEELSFLTNQEIKDYFKGEFIKSSEPVDSTLLQVAALILFMQDLDFVTYSEYGEKGFVSTVARAGANEVSFNDAVALFNGTIDVKPTGFGYVQTYSANPLAIPEEVFWEAYANKLVENVGLQYHKKKRMITSTKKLVKFK